MFLVNIAFLFWEYTCNLMVDFVSHLLKTTTFNHSMLKRSVIRLCVFLGLLCHFAILAQQTPPTIKVKKTEDLVKAEFDNVNLKLIAVDRFGNPRETSIVSYVLWIKETPEKPYNSKTFALTAEMLQALNACKSSTKIFFTNIVAQETDGHQVKLPDVIDVWFPDCKNCSPKRMKKRR